MKVGLTADYVPQPGTTITRNYLYGLVDNLQISDFQNSDFAELGGSGALLVAASPASGVHPLLESHSGELFMNYPSTVSAGRVQLPQLLVRTTLGYYEGPADTPVKGQLCWFPSYADNQFRNRAFSGWSNYSCGVYWHVPRLCLSNYLLGHFWSWYNNTTYQDSYCFNRVYGVVERTVGSAKTVVNVVEHGFCDALVHSTFSNSFEPGDVYAVHYAEAQGWMVPVSMRYTDLSAFTITEIPLGVVRQVFTDSGTTLVPLVTDDETPGDDAAWYVARVFFGGIPCL